MNIVFRVDSSIFLGGGHVYRCLTLANYLSSMGCHCRFICQNTKGNLIDLIESSGYEVHVIPECLDELLDAKFVIDEISCLKDWKINWFVIDNYQLGFLFESSLKEFSDKIFVIDDLSNRKHYCDLLLDQNFGKTVSDYVGLVGDGCRVLSGANFALIRSQFPTRRSISLKRRDKPSLKKIMISMGSVDVDNATGIILSLLSKASLPDLVAVTVVLGKYAPWLPAVYEQIRNLPFKVNVCVDVDNMAELMVDADLAIGAGGSTSWERCCLGVPTLMVVLAENQRLSAQALHDNRAALMVDIKDENAVICALQAMSKAENLKEYSFNSCKLVDGYGSFRVALAMKSILHGISLRSMAEQDIKLVYEWRTHSDIKKYMYSVHEISIDEHMAWYQSVKNNPDKFLLIYEVNGKPSGFINITKKNGDGTWGFYIAPDAKKGNGIKLGLLALDYAFDILKIRHIRAEVINFNSKSLFFHKRLGFSENSTLKNKYFDGFVYHDVIQFVLSSDEWDISKNIILGEL